MSDNTEHEDRPDEDRKTFGVSASNRETLEALVNEGHFRTAIGAFQSAAMFAIQKNLDPTLAPSSTGTMWNRGSVNSQVLEFLTWYLPTSTPVRELALYGNTGLAYISEKVKSGGYDLSEIFELPELDVD